MSIFVQWENNKTPLNAENLNVINDVARQLGEDVAHLSDVVVDIDENFSAKVQNELTEVKSSINTINETTSELQQQTSSNNTNITNIQKTIADNNSALEEKINTNKNNLTTLQSVVNDNKTELNGKITTNKNNLDALQQNVNNINSTLDNKITVNKNKLDNLEQNINNVNSTLDGKIATNKDSISNIQNSLLTGQYTSYSGTNLTCNDTLSSKTSSMLIKGQTYQNLVNGNPYYAGANTSLFHWELSENDSKITIKRTQTGDINWQYVGVPININLLKNDTTYTVIFLASGKCECVNAYINIMEGSAINSLGGKNVPRISGVNKCKFTTDHNTKIQNQILYIGIDRSELPNVNDYMTLSNFVLLEGDWTNKEVPSSITGIESIGERENNKISILSHNKNLFTGEGIDANANGLKYKYEDGIVYVSGTSITTFVNSKDYKVKGLEIGKSYTFSTCTASATDSGALYGVFRYNKNNKTQYLSTNNTIEWTSDCFNPTLYVQCEKEGATYNNATVKIQLEEGIKATSYEPHKEYKKEILLPIEGGLKSLPNGTCDTIEQREDGVYLVQRIGKIDLANANYSVSVDSEAGLIVRTKINNIKQLAIDNYICNILVGICNAWDFDYWKDGGFPIAINTENMKNQGQSGLEILVQKRQITSITDVNSFKKYLQDNSAVIYYELETPVETKLDTKDINVETFDGLTYILTNNNIQPELELKIPSNLGALIQNNAKKINELFKLIDELIIPQLTTNTSNIAMLQITK